MNIRKLVAVLMATAMLCLVAPAAMAESGSTWDRVKAAGSDLLDKTKEKAPEVWQKTKDKASEVYDKAKQKAPEVKEKVKDGVNNAQDKVSDFRENQEDQFWKWFDDQTGGTTNAAPSTDDAHNPDGNAEYEPNPGQDPEYEPGPDSVTGGATVDDGSGDGKSSASQPASSGILQEVLDKYAQDGIYYYNPNGSDEKSVSDETPETIVIDGKIYRYVPEESIETQQPGDREYSEVIVDGKIYRHYRDPGTETKKWPYNAWQTVVCIIAAGFLGGLLPALVRRSGDWIARRLKKSHKSD